jgi:hypothetical protein
MEPVQPNGSYQNLLRRGGGCCLAFSILTGAFFAAIFLAAMMLALAPRLAFNIAGPIICPEGTQVLYELGDSSEYRDPDGNVSNPRELLVSCVSPDGERIKDKELAGMAAFAGVMIAVFMVPALIIVIVLRVVMRKRQGPPPYMPPR